MTTDLIIPTEFQQVASMVTAREVMIGGRHVLGIEDARALHIGLGVGKDFTTWIKGRIRKYGLREGVDFEAVAAKESCSPELVSKHGGHNATVYRLTLDTAKELAMVENNDMGRIIRRYFLWCEDQAQSSQITPAIVGGVLKGVVNKALKEAIEQTLPALLEAKLAEDPRLAVREMVSAKEVLDAERVPSKGRRGLVRRASNGILDYSARMGLRVRKCARTNTRLFQPEAANGWLLESGLTAIKEHADRVNGQGRLFPIQGGK